MHINILNIILRSIEDVFRKKFTGIIEAVTRCKYSGNALVNVWTKTIRYNRLF
jgi:hypothetical protein